MGRSTTTTKETCDKLANFAIFTITILRTPQGSNGNLGEQPTTSLFHTPTLLCIISKWIILCRGIIVLINLGNADHGLV